jgi:RNA polymerase sigma-70 factor, ECF subfamily
MKLSPAEFEKLALEHIDMLYRMALRLTRNPERAEDLVQDTYVRAIRARDTFKLETYGIRPWLLRILHNLYLSTGERESRAPVLMDDEFLQEAAGSTSPHQQLPIDPASFQAMDERLVRALDNLPVEYRSAMLLWAVEDFSYKEIADVLDIPMGTVMSRLHRARQRLAGELKDLAHESGIGRK